MADADLAGRIRRGEDSALERKSLVLEGGGVRAPDPCEFADDLAAMANGRGGTVVLGVDDGTREVRGIPLADLDAAEGWVREVCNDSVTPPLDADIRKIELEGAAGGRVPVVRVDLARSLFVHRSPGGYFRRLGSSRPELAPEALARLFQDRSQSRVIRFDESIVPRTAPSDLHYSLTRRFSREDTSSDTLHKLRIVGDDDDGAERLTLSGVLLCTPDPQRWLPQATIQTVSCAGERTDVDYQTDARGGVPIIRAECERLSGRLPEYRLIDDSELRLAMRAAG